MRGSDVRASNPLLLHRPYPSPSDRTVRQRECLLAHRFKQTSAVKPAKHTTLAILQLQDFRKFPARLAENARKQRSKNPQPSTCIAKNQTKDSQPPAFIFHFSQRAKAKRLLDPFRNSSTSLTIPAFQGKITAVYAYGREQRSRTALSVLEWLRRFHSPARRRAATPACSNSSWKTGEMQHRTIPPLYGGAATQTGVRQSGTAVPP